jgi:hypothetical protein
MVMSKMRWHKIPKKTSLRDEISAREYEAQFKKALRKAKKKKCKKKPVKKRYVKQVYAPNHDFGF